MIRLFFAQRTRKSGGEQEAKLGIAADELVPVESGGDEVILRLLGRGFLHADHFASAAQIHFYTANSSQCDDVLNRPANLHLRIRGQKNATGADVAGQSAVGAVAIVHDAHRQFKLEALISSLVHHLLI